MFINNSDFTDESQLIASRTVEIATSRGGKFIDIDHVIYAIFESPSKRIETALHKIGVDISKVQTRISSIVTNLSRPSGKKQKKITRSPSIAYLLEKAKSESYWLGSNKIKPEHILLGTLHWYISNDKNSAVYKTLAKHGIYYEVIRNILKNELSDTV